jgi:hypothetical protein
MLDSTLDSTQRRTDKGDPSPLQSFNKAAVLRKEAVAGVDGLSACDLSCLDDVRDREIALYRGSTALITSISQKEVQTAMERTDHANSFIRCADVQSMTINL